MKAYEQAKAVLASISGSRLLGPRHGFDALPRCCCSRLQRLWQGQPLPLLAQLLALRRQEAQLPQLAGRPTGVPSPARLHATRSHGGLGLETTAALGPRTLEGPHRWR